MGLAFMLAGCGNDPPPLPGFNKEDAGPCAFASVNYNLDPNNCGACGNVCAPGARCSRGECLSEPETPAYTLCGSDPRLCETGDCRTDRTTAPLCTPHCGFDNECAASPLGGGTVAVCLFDTGWCAAACGPGDTCPDGQRCGTTLARTDRGYVKLCAP